MAKVWSWDGDSNTYGSGGNGADGTILTVDTPNAINTFAGFGIASLPNSTRCSSLAKNQLLNEGASRLIPYYDTLARTELYWRHYFLIPTGFMLYANYTTSLKWLRLSSTSSVDTDTVLKLAAGADCDGTSLMTIGVQGSPADAGSNLGIAVSGITRAVWHYFEIHVKAQAGNDLIEIWYDSDARYNPATWTKNDVDIYNTSFPWQRIDYNSNYSGNNGCQTQDWYCTKMWVDDASPIGDTAGLLTVPPPSAGVQLSPATWVA